MIDVATGGQHEYATKLTGWEELAIKNVIAMCVVGDTA